MSHSSSVDVRSGGGGGGGCCCRGVVDDCAGKVAPPPVSAPVFVTTSVSVLSPAPSASASANCTKLINPGGISRLWSNSTCNSGCGCGCAVGVDPVASSPSQDATPSSPWRDLDGASACSCSIPTACVSALAFVDARLFVFALFVAPSEVLRGRRREPPCRDDDEEGDEEEEEEGEGDEDEARAGALASLSPPPL